MRYGNVFRLVVLRRIGNHDVAETQHAHEHDNGIFEVYRRHVERAGKQVGRPMSVTSWGGNEISGRLERVSVHLFAGTAAIEDDDDRWRYLSPPKPFVTNSGQDFHAVIEAAA